MQWVASSSRPTPITSLDRHSESLRGNRRLNMPYRNLDRMDPADMREIRRRGQVLRERFDA